MNDSLTTKYLQIQGVAQSFKTQKGVFQALRNIDLNVAKGEFVALIGHSGCGKSTLLNLIAGLTLPTDGTLLCANREIAGPGPDRGMVFQNHSLLPWLTCFENIYLGVESVFGGRESKRQLVERTEAALELVGMSHATAKRPHEISGGMKQRVGIARALACGPSVLLCDEAAFARGAGGGAPFTAFCAIDDRDKDSQAWVRPHCNGPRTCWPCWAAKRMPCWPSAGPTGGERIAFRPALVITTNRDK